MDVRRLRADEIETLVCDLWLPFAREMADLDPYNRLAEDVRESAVAYREDLLEDDDVATFVSASADRIVGYAVVRYAEPPPVFARGPEATIEEVYVVPERRGEGVATDLMTRAEAWADDHGCERVALAVNRENDDAIGLYESLGYSVRRHKMDRRLA